MCRHTLLAGAASIITLTALSNAFAAPPPTELGRWPYGPATAIARDGDLIWLGGGTTLQAWRFTPPETLEKIGEVGIADPAREIVVDGDLAYLAVGDEGLQVVDIGEPAHPAVLGTIRTTGIADGVAVGDGVAWVAATRAGVRGYDITDPSRPRLIAALVPAVLAEDVELAGGVLWVASNDGLHAIDISDPEGPSFLSTTGPLGLVKITIVGHLAYGAAEYGGLQIFDVSDPDHPEALGQYTQFEYATSDVAVAGSTAFLACGGYLSVVDVSDPDEPVDLGHLSEVGGSGFGRSLAAADDWLAVADGADGLRVVDVSNPTLPSVVVSSDVPGYPSAVAALDEQHVVLVTDLDGEGALRIIDVSDPAGPRVVGGPVGPDLSYWAWLNDLEIAGDFVYLSDIRHQIHIFDVSDPTSPSYIRTHEIQTESTEGLYVENGLLVIAARHSGLVILDLGNPTMPVEIGRFEPSETIYDVALDGSLAYLTGFSAGLMVVDLTTPSDPMPVAQVSDFWGQQLAIDGSVVSIAASWDGLVAVDVTSPLVPVELDRFESGDTGRVAVQENVAAISTWQRDNCWYALRILDVSNPSRPVERCTACIQDPRFAFVGERLAVADRYGGLRLYDLETCMHPNPPSGLSGREAE